MYRKRLLRRRSKSIEINDEIFAKTKNANNTNIKILNEIEISNNNDCETKNIIIKKRRNVMKLFYSNNRDDILINDFLNKISRFRVFIIKILIFSIILNIVLIRLNIFIKITIFL